MSSDEDIAALRRSAATPLERFQLVIEHARRGQFGLAYCRDDDEINAAAREGKRITSKLLSGDVVLVEQEEKDYSVIYGGGPFVATITLRSHETPALLVIDALGGSFVKSFSPSSEYASLRKSMHLTVWFREGKPCL